MDPPADRHPHAPHRRPRRGDQRPGEGSGARGDRSARASRPADIDLIIVGTTTPDTIFPSTACLLQHKIGATNAWGFDLLAACSGFTFALATASQMLAARRHQYALVVGADVMSSIIDYTDRATCVLFGDGAGAVVLRGRGRRRARHHRLRARDRRQRRAGALHAGRRQPHAGVARDRREAAALREAGRPGGLQVRRAQDRGDLPARCSTQERPRPPTTSTCSCRTRPTAASSRRRPSASACPRRRSSSTSSSYGNTTAATIPLALDDARQGRPPEARAPRAARRRSAPGFTVGSVLVRWG